MLEGSNNDDNTKERKELVKSLKLSSYKHINKQLLSIVGAHNKQVHANVGEQVVLENTKAQKTRLYIYCR